MGTADTPAAPIIGLILPPLSPFRICPNQQPPAVLAMKAISPRTMILIVPRVRNLSASIVAPTVSDRKIVVVFMIAFWAVSLRRSAQPHSRSRLPNISTPIKGTDMGRIRPVTTVTTMGNKILSSLLTGRSLSIVMARSALLVHSLMIGGWIRGTSDM